MAPTVRPDAMEKGVRDLISRSMGKVGIAIVFREFAPAIAVVHYHNRVPATAFGHSWIASTVDAADEAVVGTRFGILNHGSGRRSVWFTCVIGHSFRCCMEKTASDWSKILC